MSESSKAPRVGSHFLCEGIVPPPRTTVRNTEEHNMGMTCLRVARYDIDPNERSKVCFLGEMLRSVVVYEEIERICTCNSLGMR